MSATYGTLEQRMKWVFNALRDERYFNVVVAARAYDFQTRTFQMHVKKVDFRKDHKSTHTAFSPAQEQILLKYIVRLDSIDMSFKIKMIRSAANHLFKLADSLNSKSRRVFRNWVIRFADRYDVYKKKQKSLNVARKASEELKQLKQHFVRFRRVCKKRNIKLSNLYNMNETDFRVNCDENHWILTLNKLLFQKLNDLDNRESVTSIECINSIEFSVFFYFIVFDIEIQKRWFQQNKVVNDMRIDVFDTDYFNDDIALKWIQHFDRYIKFVQKEVWRLLIMNDHDSHMTWKFLNYALIHRIELFVFSAHSTHFTQSLNVDVFQSFKHHHKDVVNLAMRYECDTFTKVNFFFDFSRIHDFTFTKLTLVHAWKKTDFVSYDSDHVLAPIRARIARNREKLTSSSSIIPLNARIPREVQKVIERFQQLNAAIRVNEALISSTKRIYLQYVKDSKACAHSRELSKQKLLETKIYQLVKNLRNSQPKRVVQKHDSVFFDMIRAQKQQREKSELEKTKKRIRRNEIALKRERVALEKERFKSWASMFTELKKTHKAYNKRVTLEKRSRTVYKRCMVAIRKRTKVN